MEITPKVQFLGMTFDLTVMIGTVVTMILVLLILLPATRGKKMRPRGLQNLMEMAIEFAQGITRIMMEKKQAEKYVSFTFTILFFILISNLLGVFVMVEAHATGSSSFLGLTTGDLNDVDGKVNWFKSPTANINVTVALAVAVTLFAHFAGLFKSPRHYFKEYVDPHWAMFPIKIIDEVSKPVTHAARLWANIFAGEILILILRDAAFYFTGIPLMAWIGFSIFVGFIQAYIFAVLAMVYISQKVADNH